jgi:hypothetical protein
MFIGHYKSVASPKEFYSEKKHTLQFPMQVDLNGEKYLLNNTIQIGSSKQEEGLKKAAEKNSVQHSVKIS